MEQAVIIIIAIVLLLLPFFYLAKAIFFFRENRTLKYRSINIRALIYALVAVIIFGAYFSIPAMVIKMESATKSAPVGAYVGVNMKDTLVLDGFQLKHKFVDYSLNNYSSTYIISSSMSDKDPWKQVKNGIAHYLLGRKIDIENEILTLNYPVRDSYYKPQPNKKTKKNQPNPVPQNTQIITRYHLSLKSDTLILVPFSGPVYEFRYLKFANHY
jgi:hypothetical protein